MKTKIIYISGNEIFNISDIRDAFDQVRIALNLDQDTVLFGVPVDKEDAGFGAPDVEPNQSEKIDSDIISEEIEPVMENKISDENIDEQINEPVMESEIENVVEPVMETVVETVVETPVKKRGRPRKIVDTPEQSEPVAEESDQKIVPILSVLATKDEEKSDNEPNDNIEIIDDSVAETMISEESEEPETPDTVVSEEITENIEPEYLTQEIPETIEEDEADLEKLLSAITPLQEDFMEDKISAPEPVVESESENNLDATLEQLATEFVASQDKIQEETKSNGRSKIGKLRNILPFKQSKNKESQGLGDLFGWAGIAANDEDFSVPGFFTNAAGKK